MPLSDADVEALALELEGHVEQFLEDAFQDWQTAASTAIMHANDPQDDDSDEYWLIALLGNMLWAGTVFFPPAAVAGEITTATKAASVIGAAFGSNTTAQANKALVNGWSFKDAKVKLSKLIAGQRDHLKDVYVDATADWVRARLVKDVIAQESIKYHMGDPAGSFGLVDIQKHIATAVSLNAMRKYVWREFVYPNYEISYDESDRSAGLLMFMLKQIQGALDDFNTQWAQLHGQGRAWIKFEPQLKFAGLPPSAQAFVDSQQKANVQRTLQDVAMQVLRVPKVLLKARQ